MPSPLCKNPCKLEMHRIKRVLRSSWWKQKVTSAPVIAKGPILDESLHACDAHVITACYKQVFCSSAKHLHKYTAQVAILKYLSLNMERASFWICKYFLKRKYNSRVAIIAQIKKKPKHQKFPPKKPKYNNNNNKTEHQQNPQINNQNTQPKQTKKPCNSNTWKVCGFFVLVVGGFLFICFVGVFFVWLVCWFGFIFLFVYLVVFGFFVSLRINLVEGLKGEVCWNSNCCAGEPPTDIWK